VFSYGIRTDVDSFIHGIKKLATTTKNSEIAALPIMGHRSNFGQYDLKNITCSPFDSRQASDEKRSDSEPNKNKKI
jgi:hypothetical protein